MELNWDTVNLLGEGGCGPNRMVVLTGGANAGKTSVINELRNRGLSVIDEQASKIIARKGSSVRENLPAFVREIWNYQLADEAPFRRSKKLAITDRGIYDQVSYYVLNDLPMPPDLVQAMMKLESQGQFYQLAFVFETVPYWLNNGIRDDEDHEFSVRFGRIAATVYESHGVATVAVPFMPVETRVKLILDELERHCLN